MITTGALMLAMVWYPVVLFMVREPASGLGVPASWMRLAFPLAGALALLLSIGWTRSRVPDGQPREDGTLPTPAEFSQASIVGMAMAEASAVLGFIWCLWSGNGWREYLPFGLGSLLALALVSLPRGLAYWSAWESRGAARGPR